MKSPTHLGGEEKERKEKKKGTQQQLWGPKKKSPQTGDIDLKITVEKRGSRHGNCRILGWRSEAVS